MNDEIITLKLGLKNPSGGMVGGEVKIMDNISFCKFNDKNINKLIFDNERRFGNINMKYDERKDFIIEEFPGMSKEQIMEKIMLEIKRNGVKIK